MKKYIVNADDFGLTSEINEGIIQAFKNGIVRSASIVANGDAFFEAVELIRRNPELNIGVHLTLTGEKAVLRKEVIPTLVNDSGYFRNNMYHFFIDYLFNRISIHEVKKEFSAQIEKLCNYGITVTHLDSHQHIHMLPKILQICIELSEKFGIRYIRYPREKIKPQNIIFIKRIPRFVQQLTLNLFCLYSKRRMKEYIVDNFYGFFDGGNLDKKALMNILTNQDHGISEIMCHPAILRNGKTRLKYANWQYKWQEEAKTLTDKDIIKFFDNEEIELISFSDIGEK